MDFKEKIITIISEKGFDKEQIKKLLTTPPQGMGDFALPCFVLAKDTEKNPVEFAKELSEKISGKDFEKVIAQGPYVNFYLAKDVLSAQVLEKIFSNKLVQNNEKDKTMIEYSSPNTNKPLHLGHLRNNTLGLAISNLLEEKGNSVLKANLINDRGIHICKSMLAYKLFANKRDPVEEGIKPDHFVGEMYVLYSKQVKKQPELETQAQEMLKKWENGDKEVLALWKKMNKWAISGMNETYQKYGTKFDDVFLESDIFKNNIKNDIIKEGLEKSVFYKEDNGAIIAKLEPNLPDKVLLRGDGTSLYATNDLALTQQKFNDYDLDKSIWVVANEQDLYFKQLFKIFELLGRDWAKKCFHLSYGYVSLISGKMKSREGTVVDADTLIEDLHKISFEEIEKRYPELGKKEKEERSMAIALAAIKFYLLKNDAKKDMTFNPKESISFDGETGPYLQYTYARAKSILKKAEKEGIKFEKKNFDLLKKEKEKELLFSLESFEKSLDKSFEQLSLHPLAHNLLSISEKFNSFYHSVSVLNSKTKEELNARLSLVEATSKVLKKGLEILDIKALEEM